jgi:FtsH-binding integral membrane protein
MATTPREALERFASRITPEYEDWYERHATMCYRWYLALQLVVFLSSVIVAVIAALSNSSNYDRWPKYVMVILPLIGALATALLTQVRFYDLWKLREDGRIQMQALAMEAERRAAAAADDAQCSKIHEELERRITETEVKQAASFFGLYGSDFTLKMDASGKPTAKP